MRLIIIISHIFFFSDGAYFVSMVLINFYYDAYAFRLHPRVRLIAKPLHGCVTSLY